MTHPKSLYFTLASGRCGTKKLATLLSRVPDTFAEHDADDPTSFCWKRLANPDEQLEFVRNRLVEWQSLPYSHVANTTHMIGEGFFEHFLHLNVVPNIITLRRNPRDVAFSMWRLNWIPFRNRRITPWYCGPDEAGTLPYPGYEKAHSYQLCYWWCCDTERRIQQYTPVLQERGAKIWETTLPQLLDLSHFNSMLDFFGMVNVDSIPQEKVNEYEYYHESVAVKAETPPSTLLDSLEQGVLDSIPTDFREHLETVWQQFKT